ncbi:MULTISPECIES: MurR/RpiR family transcriptional regulator [Streptococcus]|uniref:HTH rpiR-type domain-containing protein n=1 Tax=Streptococcus alactolyticus TaxID=29389 RepID=A0ABY7LZJ3_STRAY|nr:MULTISPECIES: hypothetical protein [Streptococcus]WBB06998.1 hypothetical protein O6R09_03495 [Streptococcus alactolyticus]
MKASVCGGLVLNFEQLVGLHFDHLSESEKDLARYIIAHQEDIAELTLIELGQKVLMSKSTVLRFAKKTRVQWLFGNEVFYSVFPCRTSYPIGPRCD